MICKDKPFVMKKIVILLLAFLPAMAFAQSDDFGFDFSLTAEKDITKKLSVEVEGELRTRDNAQTNDRWSMGLGMDYKVAKWLKVAAGYTFLYDNNERISYYDAHDDAVLDGDIDEGDPKKRARYWGARHRFNVSVAGSRKLGHFKFSLRERWQYTYRPEHTVSERWSFLKGEYDGKEHTYSGKGKNVLRSRLQIEYDKKKCPLSPYANVELFNAWSIQKTRYTAGLDWKVVKHHSLGIFYQYQDVRNDDDDFEPNRHLIGAGYKIKF